MKRAIGCFALLLCGVGCNGVADVGGNDAAPVYDIVFRAELKDAKNGAAHFLSVDYKDPAPELMAKLKKTWPELQPWSKKPAEKAKERSTHVAAHDLKWIDRHTAEVQGGFSNGMDGRVNLYRVVNKNGDWVIESVKVIAQS
ncbi:MAG: hypothetical protein HYR84_14265 [Planctomycetes bacterium]|nr:hypothetical protein [Planctomycetota bacterium]